MTLYPSTVLMPKFDQGRAHTEKKKALMGQAEADTQAEHPWRFVPCICKRNQQVNTPLSIQFVPLSRQTDSPDQVSLPLH